MRDRLLGAQREGVPHDDRLNVGVARHRQPGLLERAHLQDLVDQVPCSGRAKIAKIPPQAGELFAVDRIDEQHGEVGWPLLALSSPRQSKRAGLLCQRRAISQLGQAIDRGVQLGCQLPESARPIELA